MSKWKVTVTEGIRYTYVVEVDDDGLPPYKDIHGNWRTHSIKELAEDEASDRHDGNGEPAEDVEEFSEVTSENDDSL